MNVLTVSAIAAFAFLFAPALAGAQDAQAPAQVGNRWGGEAHQPTREQVRQQEQAAGLRANANKERQRAEEVDQLDKDVMQRAQQGSNDGVLNGSAAIAPPP